MTDIASLLKAITEKSSLLFGGAVASSVFFAVDLFGHISAEHRTWVLPIYWVGVFCAAALLYGAFGSLLELAASRLREMTERKRARSYGIKNFQQLRTPHRRALLFVKQLNTQRFPVEGWRPLIKDLVKHYLLVHDNPGVTHWWEGMTYFTVPDHIWALMHKDGWGDDQPEIRSVPWKEDHQGI